MEFKLPWFNADFALVSVRNPAWPRLCSSLMIADSLRQQHLLVMRQPERVRNR